MVRINTSNSLTFCLFLFCLGCSQNPNKDYDNYYQHNPKDNHLESNLRYNYAIAGTKIDSNSLWIDPTFDTVSYGNLYLNRNLYMAVYFDESSCAECVSGQIVLLKKSFDLKVDDPIVFLSNLDSYRKPKLLLMSKQVESKLYNNYTGLEFLSELSIHLCYLIIGENGRILMIHVPSMENLNLTIDFFKMMEKRKIIVSKGNSKGVLKAIN